MPALPLIAVVHLLAVFLHFLTYTSAALYAHFTAEHRDMCVFYLCAAFATVLHFGVVFVEERDRRGTPQPDRPADRV